MIGEAVAWLTHQLLSKLASVGIKGALEALLGSPVERAVQKATASALLETIRALAPEADEGETRRIQDVLNQCWPELDFSPEGSGSLLESVEFMVKTAMATTTEPVRLGAAFVPTTVLDTVENETGARLDPDEFAREFIHHFIERLSRRSVRNATVAALASHLNQDLQTRMTRLQAGTAELGVEFYAHRDSMLESGTRMDDLLIGFVNRGAATASHMTFHFVADASYLDGKFLEFDGKEEGAATRILPGDDTTFRVVDVLMQHQHFRFAVWLALQGSDDEILGNRPITVEITPTYLNGVDKQPKTGPTAKALLTWSRRPGRFALTFRGQLLDPHGPTA